jgi:hypothetical protein
MVVVQIEWLTGRSPEQKEALVEDHRRPEARWRRAGRTSEMDSRTAASEVEETTAKRSEFLAD